MNRSGFSPEFEARFREVAARFPDVSLVPLRIVRENRGQYVALPLPEAGNENAGAVKAEVTGKFRHDAPGKSAFPAVGDWVAAERLSGGVALIHAVLPRSSRFARRAPGEGDEEQVVAANVDTLLVVCGLDGDFNIRRIERYLSLARDSGAVPVIVLNKTDLGDGVSGKISAVEAAAGGAAVHALSARTGEGIAALDPYLEPDRTVALVGSSGAGKSTLVNRLLGLERQKTGEVRDDDSRGRHTTTHRELIALPGGALLIDTPGMRELQLWGGEESLAGGFPEIEELAASCRFRDCTHEKEPGCAVKSALESGGLDQNRYRSYLKLRRELAALERRRADAPGYEKRAAKAAGKQIARRIKDFYKDQDS